MGNAGARFAKAGTKRGQGLASNTAGVAAIEYAILLALIAIAIVVSLRGLGNGVANNWNNVDNAVTDASGSTYNSH